VETLIEMIEKIGVVWMVRYYHHTELMGMMYYGGKKKANMEIEMGRDDKQNFIDNV